jgi:hypothetical protein
MEIAMPYKSIAQERFFHTDTAKKKGITPAVVKEFDTASKGMKLPAKKTGLDKAMSKVGGGY